MATQKLKQFESGSDSNIVQTNANYTVLANEKLILFYGTTAAQVITLPLLSVAKLKITIVNLSNQVLKVIGSDGKMNGTGDFFKIAASGIFDFDAYLGNWRVEENASYEIPSTVYLVRAKWAVNSAGIYSDEIDASESATSVAVAQAAADAAQTDATTAIADALAAQTDATTALGDTAALEAVNVAKGKTYAALITQATTADPTVVVLKNDLSAAIVWTRTSAGLYTGTLAGAFLAGKCLFSANLADPTTGTIGFSRATDNTVVVQTADPGTIGTPDTLPALADSLLNSASIEITVFP